MMMRMIRRRVPTDMELASPPLIIYVHPLDVISIICTNE